MADKSTVQPEEVHTKEVQTGFYTFLSVMAFSFILIVGYMLYLFLS